MNKLKLNKLTPTSAMAWAKQSFLVLSLVLIAGIASGQDVEYFEGSLADLKETAQVSGKPYMVKFHTSWCVICRKLDAQTFSDWELSNYINENMLAISLDGEKDRDGLAMVSQYNIRVYPTVLVFDAQGQLIHRYEGLFSPNYFLSQLN